MSNDLKDQLRILVIQWRKTAEQTRPGDNEPPDPLMRGHILGVSDGLLIAAEDVDRLLSGLNGKVPT